MPKRRKADTTVLPITGSFEDAVRAMLRTPPAPKNIGRPKAKRPAPGGEALVRSVTFKPKAKKRKATKKR